MPTFAKARPLSIAFHCLAARETSRMVARAGAGGEPPDRQPMCDDNASAALRCAHQRTVAQWPSIATASIGAVADG